MSAQRRSNSSMADIASMSTVVATFAVVMLVNLKLDATLGLLCETKPRFPFARVRGVLGFRRWLVVWPAVVVSFVSVACVIVMIGIQRQLHEKLDAARLEVVRLREVRDQCCVTLPGDTPVTVRMLITDDTSGDLQLSSMTCGSGR